MFCLDTSSATPTSAKTRLRPASCRSAIAPRVITPIDLLQSGMSSLQVSSNFQHQSLARLSEGENVGDPVKGK
jgi:hypothetical protein